MTQKEIGEEYDLFCKTAEARNLMYLEDRAFEEWEKTTNYEQKADILPRFLTMPPVRCYSRWRASLRLLAKIGYGHRRTKSRPPPAAE